MNFVHGIMLFGLPVVAIPIIIHLLNRRRARVVDWAAMRFLAASLASRNRRILLEEILLMALRCLLLAALVFALARPRVRTGRALAARRDDPQDIALVIDASLSMTLDADGTSNFQRAIDEARQVLDLCRRDDAVAVICAGPTPEAPVPSPLSDRDAIRQVLDDLTPAGGSMAAVEALHAALVAVDAGRNPVKKIIVITDAQKVGWDLSAKARWAFLAKAGEEMPTRPLVIVRTLKPPAKWRNAAVTALTFAREVIGTDRDVKITVTVANTGVGEIAPTGVELKIDHKAVETQTAGEIAEGASSSVVFEHRFESSGPHIVEARVVCEDDLPGDNATTRVVNVLEQLKVLVIEGRPSPRPLASDAAYLEVALAPSPEVKGQRARHLIDATVVAAADVGRVKAFDDYAVVVLANVARLPADRAKELALHVGNGGGLLIAPGLSDPKRIDLYRTFYNAWQTPDGKRLAGARLMEVRLDERAAGTQPADRAAHVAPQTIDHAALKLLSDPSDSDLPAAAVKRHWVLVAADDPTVSVAASLDSGDPFLIQRQYGKGYVLTLATPLDKGFSDLPSRDCFVPLVQELVHYLAAPLQRPMNVAPGRQMVYTIPGTIRGGDVADVHTPDGKRRRARLQRRQGRWQASFALTARPGLYRLVLPDAAMGALASRPAMAPTAPEMPRGIPFTVLADPAESTLEPLADKDFAEAGKHVRLARAETTGELTAAIRGGAPGREIWQYVALALLALLVAEIAATRAIAMRRKAHLAAPVAFGAEQVDSDGFRQAAREALRSPAEPASKAGGG